MHIMQSRRDFLASLSVAGATGVLGARQSLADEGPPETTTLRLDRSANIYLAPGYIADELLRAEGFTEIRRAPDVPNAAVARGEIDYLPRHRRMGRRSPGCRRASYRADGCAHRVLRAVRARAHPDHQRLEGLERRHPDARRESAPAPRDHGGQVGLDPHEDITWIPRPGGKFIDLFAKGELDAFLGFPPEPQEVRAGKVGRVILNMATDKPWSQYFRCIAYGSREFVHNHPIATKRFLRAILKAADMCATEPERAAQRLVDAGFRGRYGYALQAPTEVPYNVWRELDPEDSMRFYALRLHEAGMIKSSPNSLLAEGTDWSFLNELERELKA